IEGATVRLAGVQIGRVTAVTLPEQPGSKVRVTLTIARRFSERIRRDSEARIATQGLLGDKIVEISFGSPSAPVLKAGEARALLTAMDALGRGAEKADGRETLLSALLYDPQYKAVADDLRAVAHNFRDVSERVAQGQGLLGQLTRDGADGTAGALGDATAD